MSGSYTKYISTTVLAQKINVASKEMFMQLIQFMFIEKKGEVWSLTNIGVDAGERFKTSKQGHGTNILRFTALMNPQRAKCIKITHLASM